MPEVANVTTPFTPAQLVAALQAAYCAQLGHDPTHATLAILCGQAALETANGRSCVCNNPGNYKRGPGPDWCSFETFEYVGNPPVKTSMVCEFSAWPTLEDAYGFFVSSLYTSWPEAWAGAVAGDVGAFCAGLRKRGYFTAPLELYEAGVRRWAEYYTALLGGDPAVTEPELSPDDAAALATEGLLDSDEPPA